MRDIGRMEREFLDVLDYDLSVAEADLLDLHETLFTPSSSQPASQLHPFFHVSALERAPRPQGGVQMFRTHRVTDEYSDEESGSVSSASYYGDDLVASTLFDADDSPDAETNVETRSSDPSSQETSSSPESSSDLSVAATSASSYHPYTVSKPVTGKDAAQQSTISRALWLAGHQLISTLPTGFSQIAVSS